MNNYQADLKSVFKSTAIVGYTTSISVVIYGVIAYAILSSSANREPVFANTVLVQRVFWAIGFSVMVSIILTNRMLFQKNRTRYFEPLIVMKKLQRGSLFTFGLCESIGIMGLILTLLTKNMNDYYGHGFLSLFAFGIFFPKYHIWDMYIRDVLYWADGADSN